MPVVLLIAFPGRVASGAHGDGGVESSGGSEAVRFKHCIDRRLTAPYSSTHATSQSVDAISWHRNQRDPVQGEWRCGMA